MRVCYLLAAAGFALTSIGSEAGAAPQWPNDTVWAVIAAVAAVMLLYVAIRPQSHRDLLTSTVVVASVARMIGWLASDIAWASKLSATGVWLITCGLIFVIHHKHRLLMGSGRAG